MRRRQFLKLGLAACAATQWTRASAQSEQAPLLLSATTDLLGQHSIGGFSLDGSVRFSIPVEHRAHDVLWLTKQKLAVFFSRRPGYQAYIADPKSGELVQIINSHEGRHFFGHGCVDASGRYLFTSENDYENARGVIGVYDLGASCQRIDELPSHGVGPHQLALMPDGQTLVIGNGGIHTHPDQGRRKLNVAQMQSSLSYVELASGRRVDEYLPPDPKISLRHLDVSDTGEVAVGAQYQGARDQIVPLVFTHKGEMQLQPASASAQQWQRFNQYIASVCYLGDSRVAVTSPRGGVLAVWSDKQQTPEFVAARDCAGLAFDSRANQCVVSDGLGGLRFFATRNLDLTQSKVVRALNTRWDNHLEWVWA